jgi:high affinity Mn2+ porin
MRQAFAIALIALTCGGGACLSGGSPPVAVLTFDPSSDAKQIAPNGAPDITWKEFLDQHAPEASCVCADEEDAPGPIIGFLRRINQRSKWREAGHHPRMFGQPSALPAGADASKPKAPTTFPQALWRYLQCVRTHGEALKENKANGDDKEKKNGKDDKKSGDGEDKGGKSALLDGNQISTQEPGTNSQQQPGAGAQPPAPVPQQPGGFGELGAERGGRTINIGGETGLSPTGYQPTWFSAHAQGTVVTGVHDHFHSPYIGPLSLLPVEPQATSETTTFYFAARLWEGGEFVFNPEVAGGRGFSGSNGVAGFPNGEITRVGVVEPTPYFARLFYRHTINLGGEQEKLEDGVNQISGTRDINHLIIAFGRFSMTDVVDDNKYSHDPRTQFLAWSIMYNGAWDYPANVRGYTDGIAIDYNTKYWAIHYGITAVPRVANGSALDPRFIDANGQALEWLGRYKINEHPGNFRFLSYLNHAHMGNYGDALRLMPVDPNVTLTRVYRFKYGFGISWDQEVTKDVGVFGRWGWNDGHSEAWSFTPIDRLWELGVWINGRPWCRPHDQFGSAFCSNGLQGTHRAYLAAGGLDFNIGDGKLNYGHEMIWETVYNLGVTKNILFSLDFQEVWHPAYNRDRGPVSIFMGRFHIEF